MKHVDNGTFVLIGMPTFAYKTDLLTVPTGQISAFEKYGEINYPKLYRRLQKEYVELHLSIDRSGMPWTVALAYKERTDPHVRDYLLKRIQTGFTGTYDVKPSELIAFPRDLAVLAPNGSCLINDRALKKGPMSKKQLPPEIISSPYGEGGRVLYVPGSDVALVFDEFVALDDWQRPKLIKPPIKTLLESGFKVGYLPSHASARRTKKGWYLVPERHPDRVAGMLMDQNHRLHLVVFSHKVNSGYRDTYHKPRYGPKATLDLYRETCEQLEITLHIVDEPVVPASNGFVQFSNGKVVMTRGDSDVRAIVKSIVGRENLFLTKCNFSHYPRYALAGIRCLANELPRFFLDAIEIPDEEFQATWQTDS